MEMKKFKTNTAVLNTNPGRDFIQTQNITFANSSKANYRDRANKIATNPQVFAEKQGFSMNSPFLSKTLKGMLGGPVATQNMKQ